MVRTVVLIKASVAFSTTVLRGRPTERRLAFSAAACALMASLASFSRCAAASASSASR